MSSLRRPASFIAFMLASVKAGGRAAGAFALGVYPTPAIAYLFSKCCPVHKQAFSF